MSFLTDKEIIERVYNSDMISPFIAEKRDEKEIRGVLRKVPSYGLSHAGYDVRLKEGFEVSYEDNTNNTEIISILDDQYKKRFSKIEGDTCIIPAKGFMLGVTEEYIKMPNDLQALLVAKSTLIRKGLFFAPTNLEPGWEGELVIEIFNANPFAIELYSGIGIGQLLFAKLDTDVMIPYSGKYQGQTGIQHGKYDYPVVSL